MTVSREKVWIRRNYELKEFELFSVFWTCMIKIIKTANIHRSLAMRFSVKGSILKQLIKILLILLSFEDPCICIISDTCSAPFAAFYQPMTLRGVQLSPQWVPTFWCKKNTKFLRFFTIKSIFLHVPTSSVWMDFETKLFYCRKSWEIVMRMGMRV